MRWLLAAVVLVMVAAPAAAHKISLPPPTVPAASAPSREPMPIELCADPCDVQVTADRPSLPDGDRRAILGIAAFITLLVGIFMVFAPEIDMGWLRRRTIGDALLAAAALQLARMVHRAAVARAVGALLGGALAIAVVGNPVAVYVAIIVGLVFVRQLWVMHRASLVLALLDGSSTVTLHGDHVLRVATPAASSWLVCSERQIAIATENVLPAARVIVKNLS